MPSGCSVRKVLVLTGSQKVDGKGKGKEEGVGWKSGHPIEIFGSNASQYLPDGSV